jgi:hypothetical protein
LYVWPLLMLLALGTLGADPDPFPAPVVVVYPLTSTGGTPADVGGNIAILLSTKLSQLGGLTVKPYTPGTERAQYLNAAIQAGADYYITGFLTPVGSDVSMIAQVVSTHSGSIVFSTTAVVHTYGDVVGQGDDLRAAILRHAGRGLPAVDPNAVGRGTPAPSAGTGGGVNLTRVLGHHDRNAPAPSPSAAAAPGTASAPSVAANARTVALAGANGRFAGLVTQIDGDGTVAQKQYAQQSLAGALRNAGMSGGGILPVSAAAGVTSAKALCNANAGANVIIASTLGLGSGQYGKDSATLSVAAHACDGTLIAQEQAVENTSGKGGLSSAIDRAVADIAPAIAKRLRSRS